MKHFPLRSILIVLITIIQLNATTFSPTTLEKFISTSTAIVTARVGAVSASWDDSHQRIYTYVNLAIDQIIKGENIPDTIVLQQLGGKVGDDALIIHASPEFEESEDVLLFLVFHRGQYWVHSLAMGKFNILEIDGEKFAINYKISKDLIESQDKNVVNRSDSYQKYPLQELVAKIQLKEN